MKSNSTNRTLQTAASVLLNEIKPQYRSCLHKKQDSHCCHCSLHTVHDGGFILDFQWIFVVSLSITCKEKQTNECICDSEERKNDLHPPVSILEVTPTDEWRRFFKV